MKIGICGCHGSGKTTKAKELHDHYVDLGKTVIVVDEVARSCPHTLRTVKAQEWIWYQQMSLERHAMYILDVDVIICDRTVMDNLMYYHDLLNETPWRLLTKEYEWQIWDRWHELYQQAIEWMPTYDKVIRLPLNLEYLKADDPIRPKSEEYARRIDALFDRFVDSYVTEEPQR